MKNLIVTADDFGVFPSVNEGIIDAVKAKKVNSVSVLSNYKGEVIPGAPRGTRFESSLTNAKWLVNETAGLPLEIGCHLTVTSGKPLTGSKMEFMCDANGNFNSFMEFKNFTDKDQLDALKNELCAQVEELKSVCNVKHLTNHHNSLTLFGHHFDVYAQVAQKFELPMRSVDIRPADRQKLYIWIQDRLLTDDIPKAEREEMKAFQKKIIEHFSKINPKINSPVYMDSSHYGPVGLLPWTRLLSFGLIAGKHKDIKKFFDDFQTSDCDCAEFLVHLAKPGMLFVDRSRLLDYSGIDRNYFDSRVLEYRSILKHDFEGLNKWFEHRGWNF